MVAPDSPARRLIGGTLDHIGVVVPDLDAALAFHRDVLGLAEREVRTLVDQGLAVAFLETAGLSIELIAPLPGSVPLRDLLGAYTAQDFLAANPAGGLHHLCFRTPDPSAAGRALAGAGVPVLGDGRGVVGASGRRVVFFAPVPPSPLLIEIKEAA